MGYQKRGVGRHRRYAVYPWEQKQVGYIGYRLLVATAFLLVVMQC